MYLLHSDQIWYYGSKIINVEHILYRPILVKQSAASVSFKPNFIFTH